MKRATTGSTSNVASKFLKSVSGRRRRTRIDSESDDDPDDTNQPTSPSSTPSQTVEHARDHEVIDIDADEAAEKSKEGKIKTIHERIAKRNSPIYAFYHKDPDIEFDSDGNGKYVKFVCTACSEVKKQGLTGSDKGSTGKMKQHTEKCWSADAVKAVYASGDVEKARAALKKYGKTSQSKLTLALKTVKGWAESFSTRPPSKGEIRVVTARWVSESARPFKIVKDRCFHWLQKEGRPERYIPSRETVSRDVKHLHTKTKEKLAEELQAYDGKLSIALDCWTSPNHRAWMSIIVSYLRKGTNGEEEPVTYQLDFIELPCSHSGKNMAEAVVRVLKEYGIEDKIISVTCDNATANDKMIEELANELPTFLGSEAHVRCFAHVVNLTAKGVLRPFEPKNSQTGDTEVEELRAQLKDLEENGVVDADDNDGFVDVIEEMTDEEKEQWEASVEPIRTALTKARRISFKIINSPTLLLPRWKEITAGTEFENRVLPRDVSTRWNSTYDMLKAFIEMKKPVVAFLDRASYGLSEYSLTSQEWDAIGDLVLVLKILKDATEFFSSNSPNIAAVIPAMDRIDEAFATGLINNHTLSPPIRHALSIGKRMLNKYYALTDNSSIYRMAMILHPSFKLEYFDRLQWEKGWIDTAVAITRKTWERRYKREKSASSSSGIVTPTVSTERVNSFISFMSAQTMVASSDSEKDQLDRYLADSCVQTEDPLRWWLANRKLYPDLARFAISIHCVMASAVPVERSFSRGRILISHLRNRLRANTIRALMCFGDWSHQDFINNVELEGFLSDKGDDEGIDLIDDDDEL